MNFSVLQTPQKNASKDYYSRLQDTIDQTQRKQQTANFEVIDYRRKALELFNQNTQLKIMQKKYQSHIQSLKCELENIKEQVNRFLEQTQYKSLIQATYDIKLIKSLQKGDKNTVKDVQSKHGYFNMYKQMDKHYNFVISQKYQQISKLIKQREINMNNQRDIQNQKINEMMAYQNICLKQTNQKLQNDLKNSIDKFQHIQQMLQEKMQVYVDKIREYQAIISKYQDQEPQKYNQQGQNNNQVINACQFSFNDEQNILKEQEIKQRQNEDLSAQCYRASIEGLLDQNKRLKKSFQALSKLKQGQQIPNQLMKQIHIMNSILQLNENLQNIDS